MRAVSKGFTLIELIVTLAVATLLVGIGVPAFSGTVQGLKARTAASDLQTAMAAARLRAVSDHAAVSVCPSSDGLRCRTDGIWDRGWIVFKDPARSGQPADSAAVFRQWQTSEGVNVRASTARPVVRFLPHGAASGTNLTITVCVGRAVQQIVVNNAGRTRRERRPSAICS